MIYKFDTIAYGFGKDIKIKSNERRKRRKNNNINFTQRTHITNGTSLKLYMYLDLVKGIIVFVDWLLC